LVVTTASHTGTLLDLPSLEVCSSETLKPNWLVLSRRLNLHGKEKVYGSIP